MAYFQAAPVVVGYDGSPSAHAALMAAADEAARRDLRLTIVYAEEAGIGLQSERGAIDPLVEAMHRVRPILDRSRVSLRDRRGPASQVLCEQAETAELLVVGRGEVGLLGWFAGSVAVDVLCAARCPVLIVGDAAPHVPHPGPVVAGVDRAHAGEVLAAAFREADLRRSELLAVHSGTGSADERWLHEAVDPYQRKYPDVAITEVPCAGRPAHVLAEFGHAASVIVVGTRGRGPVAGLLFGSVGQSLLRRAACPVLVVR